MQPVLAPQDPTSGHCRSYRLSCVNSRGLKSRWAGRLEPPPVQPAEVPTAYLDNIAILDDCPQQLSVLGLVLLLFQICRMLKLQENKSAEGCFIKERPSAREAWVTGTAKNWGNSKRPNQRNSAPPTVTSHSPFQLFQKAGSHHFSSLYFR